MASEFRFQLTEKAAGDLDSILSYMANDLCNPSAASNFMDRLQAAIKEICLFPESCPKVINEFVPEMNLRKKIVDHYVLYYLPDMQEKTIVVLRIVYGKRDMNAILSSL